MAKSGAGEKNYIPPLISELPDRPTSSLKVMVNNILTFENAIFDIDEVMGSMAEWLGRHKYVSPGRNFKERPKPTGTEIKIKSTAIKAVDRYSRYKISVKFELFRVNNINVKNSDKVLKYGDFNVSISAQIDLDYEHEWDKTPFHRYLKHLYEKYIYEPKMIKHKVQLESEAKALKSVIKLAVSKYL